MGGNDRVKLLCSFGGEFLREGGKPFYYGGKTRLVSIDRSSSFRSLMAKMVEVSNADSASIEIVYQLPDGSLTLDSRLISVENDDDVRNMIDEYSPDRKVPIFLFSEKVGDDESDEDGDDEVDNEEGDDGNSPASVPIDCERETETPDVREPISSQSGASASASPSRGDDANARDPAVTTNMALEMFRKDSQSIAVGQEYEDVQTCRNALSSFAIAANFELHMIQSEQRRVTARETATPAVEEPVGSQSGPSASASPSRTDDVNARATVDTTNMALEIFRKDSQSLVVGQEYEDVQTFRNALSSAAIAANFELYMIRSDQRRVTARCAVEGCTWRVHASRISHVSTFRVRTLVPEHTCERSADAGHRQATTKWIANCIRERLRQNKNYKPKEILSDIYREYGVLITYKRAFLAREKALEELRTEQVPIENNYENSMVAWGEIDDPSRQKRLRVNRPASSDDPRALHCTWCNQIGHNRRTCNVLEFLQGQQGSEL